MQRHRISADEAFATLVRTSQETNVRLREVAGYVVEHLERSDARAERAAEWSGPRTAPSTPAVRRPPDPAPTEIDAPLVAARAVTARRHGPRAVTLAAVVGTRLAGRRRAAV
jgi:hypothetical protein